MFEAILQADWRSIGPWVMLGGVVLSSASVAAVHWYERRQRIASDMAWLRLAHEWKDAADGKAFKRWNNRRDWAATLPEPLPHAHTYDCVRSDIVVDEDGTVLMACCVAGCTEIKVYAPGEFMPARR